MTGGDQLHDIIMMRCMDTVLTHSLKGLTDCWENLMVKLEDHLSILEDKM